MALVRGPLFYSIAVALVLGAHANVSCPGIWEDGQAACPDASDTTDMDGSISLLQTRTQMLKEELPPLCVPNFRATAGPAYSEKQQLGPNETLNLYQALHSIDVIFKKHNITFWAAWGTLLGALRNEGIIPHDDDIDFHFFSEDLPKLFDGPVKDALARNDIRTLPMKVIGDDKPAARQIFSISTCQHIGSFYSMSRTDNNQLRDRDPKGVAYPADVAEHLELWPFGDSTVPAPSRDIAEAFLDAFYGSDWNTAANCNGAGHDCDPLQNESWDLTGKAMPPGPLREPVL